MIEQVGADPMWIKTKAREFLNDYKLSQAIRAIKKLPAGTVPDRKILTDIVSGWSNDGFVARIDYLHEVASRAAATEGPVLECGTGITTIILGLMTQRRQVQVFSLENSAEWLKRVQAVLDRNGLSNVNACFSPLRDYGDFDWYDPPFERLPEKFSLVVCDGPPGTTKGGRYGLLPVMGERLSASSVILLDDTDRPEEQTIMNRWISESNLREEVVNGGAAFAVLGRRS
jgi:hypothetical protein